MNERLKFVLEGEGKSLDSEQFANYLGDLVNKYPIISVEDGMDEGDLVGWKLLTEKIGSRGICIHFIKR